MWKKNAELRVVKFEKYAIIIKGDDMGMLDILLIAGALALIVAPNWTYNVGRKEPVEVPKNWHIISRVAGVIFLGISALFLYWQYT